MTLDVLWRYGFLSALNLNSNTHHQERAQSDLPVSLSLHDRSFDLVLLSNWEEQIIYDPDDTITQSISKKETLTTPVNTALESGIWTQSIIWDAKTPFRDFAQIEFNHEDDIIPEDRQITGEFVCYSFGIAPS